MKTDSGGSPEIEFTPRSQLLEAHSERGNLLTNFKKLWNEESLLSLRESCKNLNDMDFNKIQVDDIIVLIKNLAKARPFWKLGRVAEIFCGNFPYA